MKLYIKYQNDIVDKFRTFNEKIRSTKCELVTESSDVTYYELRQFVTLLMSTVNQRDSRSVLNDILLGIGKLEVLGKPTPSIRKLKGVSPKVFK